MWKSIKTNILYIAWAVALLAVAGSIYFSNVLHWVPCVLCWYQRIFLYPLVLVIAIGIIRKIKDTDILVLSLAFIGAAIALYHNFLQWGIISEKLAPCTVGAPCTTDYHLWFKFLTVPLMSLIAFVIIIICMFIYRKEKSTI